MLQLILQKTYLFFDLWIPIFTIEPNKSNHLPLYTGRLEMRQKYFVKKIIG